MKVRLNDRFVATARATGAETKWHDTEVRGLVLRLRDTGARSWMIEKTINSRTVRKAICDASLKTVEQARVEARRLLNLLDTGQDLGQREHAALTLADLMAEYLQSRKSMKPSSKQNLETEPRRYLEDLLRRPISSISPDVVLKRHAELKGTPAAANRIFRNVRAAFNYGVAKGYTTTNPVNVLGKTRGWYKLTARTGFLHADEIAAFWKGTGALAKPSQRDYLRLLLLTGLRKAEGLNLLVKDVDTKRKTITARETKNSVPHTLPAPKAVMALLTPHLKGKKPDDPVFTECRDMRTALGKLPKIVTLHDLRRSFSSVAAQPSLGIGALALARLLNHKSGIAATVTSHYVTLTVEDLREPMERIVAYVLKAAKAN